MTVLMKLFLENKFYLSKYSEMRRTTGSRSARMKDAYASACLRMVNAVNCPQTFDVIRLVVLGVLR
jgi:hypothetical protein